VRRLVSLAARAGISQVAPRIPRSFASASGASPSRATTEAFQASVLARIVDHAFGLDGDHPVPRTRRAFEEIVERGTPRIEPSFRLFADAIARASAELDATLQALRSAAKHPGAKVAISEIRAQIELLFPADLIAWVPLSRLEHFPRYLRAAQARLGRAIADPRRDSEKFAQVAPLWASFVAKQGSARDRDAAGQLRWSFEELRVAVFAPELKTPAPVSVAKLKSDLAQLR
jgi:ATP-dependent helicase HrpA